MRDLASGDAHCQMVRRERRVYCGLDLDRIVRAVQAPVQHTHREYVPSSGYSAFYNMIVTLLWYKHGFNLPYFCRLRGACTDDT